LIGIGFCHEDSDFTGMPGWGIWSWAHHGDDGKLFLETGSGSSYGDTFGTGDVVGCGSDITKDELFFTKNGKYISKSSVLFLHE
jgi:hypothetical protein